MRKMQKSYERFYSKAKDDILNTEVVVDYIKSHDGDIGKFRRDMFCPECKQAELTFVNETSKRCAHLRKIKTSNHKEECSYNYEYVPKEVSAVYIDTLDSRQMQDILNSMMNMLCREQNAEKVDISYTKEFSKKERNPMTIVQKNSTTERKLPQKSLNVWIDSNNCNERNLYAFYGQAKLKVKENQSKNNNKYYVLELYTNTKKNEWKYKTRIYRSGIKDSVKEDVVYNIVVIGYLKFHNGNNFQIELANKTGCAIKYQEI